MVDQWRSGYTSGARGSTYRLGDAFYQALLPASHALLLKEHPDTIAAHFLLNVTRRNLGPLGPTR